MGSAWSVLRVWLGAAVPSSFCVTAYVVEDLCGDTEAERVARSWLGRDPDLGIDGRT